MSLQKHILLHSDCICFTPICKPPASNWSGYLHLPLLVRAALRTILARGGKWFDIRSNRWPARAAARTCVLTTQNCTQIGFKLKPQTITWNILTATTLIRFLTIEHWHQTNCQMWPPIGLQQEFMPLLAYNYLHTLLYMHCKFLCFRGFLILDHPFLYLTALPT